MPVFRLELQLKVEVMDDYRQIILGTKPGQIIPIVKQIDIDDPMDFFAELSDYSRARNYCCLFESGQ